MDMELARKMLRDALNKGLQLHGISENGKPAIGFDADSTDARVARRKLLSTEGVMRELIRAAMIEECQRQGLPEGLPVPFASALLERQDQPDANLLH